MDGIGVEKEKEGLVSGFGQEVQPPLERLLDVPFASPVVVREALEATLESKMPGDLASLGEARGSEASGGKELGKGLDLVGKDTVWRIDPMLSRVEPCEEAHMGRQRTRNLGKGSFEDQSS